MLSLLSQILANGVSPPSAPTSIELTLPEGTGPEALIPLTALLLEYPVAYMLTTAGLESQAILSGVALDVYECIVSHPPLLPKGKANTEIGRGETTLVKFSCPAHLAGSYPDLHPSRMVDKVKARFEERLCRLSLEEVMDVRVKHGVETLDRVAL
ncbi:hypothetical protein GLOTRDRAFT_129786 [Gloeophyllum trabeum ATCC 11539]|uniref:Uncharacterized protein n=1 Tax=Gloeophyllum trabeum (strain ATCC 11539 / FP-39264 / Madison 617) TaxID=670483 RepID=S7Q341_GLOTA|nr:uncharacterized protein GLOTRDRAFT_129786 [Gloeophyllum trabeum ATCC 11539]EPQ54426.1 hypothetical protein GLOTRDRAFT_129786 [Gloeophyllum trabeum ATCC 11539]